MIGAPVRRQGPPGDDRTLIERSRPGRRAWSLPELDVPPAEIPQEHRRREAPKLPEVSELDLVRHVTRLSQMNYGIDTGPYPLGSCTMKYNPKMAETVAGLPGFQRLHPLQPDATTQGALELLWELERALCAITGTARATLQPPAGACGELTGLLIMRAHHSRNGGDARRKVIIPDSAHGTNPASVRFGGFEPVKVRSDARGLVDVSMLEKLVDEDVAGLMLTNPNTLGLFEEEIVEIARIVHDAGGLLYYDGANLNAILGRCRPGDMGFDIVHINTHKTFATPHGGGGPGAGPVGVTEELARFLPTPMVERSPDGSFSLEHDRPDSIGPVHGFWGNFAVLVRAFAYLTIHGADGLQTLSESAVLNANYLAILVDEAYPRAYLGPPMHEFVVTAKRFQRSGLHAMDLAKRMIDLGSHPPTVAFPLVVEEALMVEPTEAETKETLDGLAQALLQVAREAEASPELLHEAPVTTPVRRLDEARAARHLKLRWESQPD